MRKFLNSLELEQWVESKPAESTLKMTQQMKKHCSSWTNLIQLWHEIQLKTSEEKKRKNWLFTPPRLLLNIFRHGFYFIFIWFRYGCTTLRVWWACYSHCLQQTWESEIRPGWKLYSTAHCFTTNCPLWILLLRWMLQTHYHIHGGYKKKKTFIGFQTVKHFGLFRLLAGLW